MFRKRPNSVAVILTCMGRACHLKQSLPRLLEQDYPEELFKIVIVDWSSPDDLQEYVRSLNSKNVALVTVLGKRYFHLSAARNAGAAYAMKAFKPRFLHFTDCDIMYPHDFLSRNVQQYEYFKERAGWFRDVFLHSKKLLDGSFDIWGSCFVPARQWKKWKYNEAIDTYGHEDNEFYNCMREHRCKNQAMLVGGVRCIKHDDALRMQYYRERPEDMRRIRLENMEKFRYHGHFDR